MDALQAPFPAAVSYRPVYVVLVWAYMMGPIWPRFSPLPLPPACRPRHLAPRRGVRHTAAMDLVDIALRVVIGAIMLALLVLAVSILGDRRR